MQRRIDFIENGMNRAIAKRHVEARGMRTAEAIGVERILCCARRDQAPPPGPPPVSAIAHAGESCWGGYKKGLGLLAPLATGAKIPPLEPMRIKSSSNPE